MLDIQIREEDKTILVNGMDNKLYPDNGSLSFPMNSLIMECGGDMSFDNEEDMRNQIILFRSVDTFDVLFSAKLKDLMINGMNFDDTWMLQEEWGRWANKSGGGMSQDDKYRLEYVERQITDLNNKQYVLQDAAAENIYFNQNFQGSFYNGWENKSFNIYRKTGGSSIIYNIPTDRPFRLKIYSENNDTSLCTLVFNTLIETSFLKKYSGFYDTTKPFVYAATFIDKNDIKWFLYPYVSKTSSKLMAIRPVSGDLLTAEGGTPLTNIELDTTYNGYLCGTYQSEIKHSDELLRLEYLRDIPYTLNIDGYTIDCNIQITTILNGASVNPDSKVFKYCGAIFLPKYGECFVTVYYNETNKEKNIIVFTPEKSSGDGSGESYDDTEIRQELGNLRGDVENALGDIAALEIDKQNKLSGNYLATFEADGGHIDFAQRSYDGLTSSTKTIDFKTINGQAILGQGDIKIDVPTIYINDNLEFDKFNEGENSLKPKYSSDYYVLKDFKLGDIIQDKNGYQVKFINKYLGWTKDYISYIGILINPSYVSTNKGLNSSIVFNLCLRKTDGFLYSFNAFNPKEFVIDSANSTEVKTRASISSQHYQMIVDKVNSLSNEWTGTQSEYDALGTYDDKITYYIVEE